MYNRQEIFALAAGKVAPFVELLVAGDFQSEADVNQDNVVDLFDVTHLWTC